jgi:hypothetical protein
MQQLPDHPVMEGHRGYHPYVRVKGIDENFYVDIKWASGAEQNNAPYYIGDDEIVHVSLDLSGHGIRSLRDIGGLDTIPRIDALYLSDNNLTSLDGFDKMPWVSNLKELWVDRNNLRKVEGLHSLISLQILVLGENKIEDMNGIEKLKLLSILSIRRNTLKDVTPIMSLKKLIDLDLAGNQIQNLDCLVNQALLKRLNISSNPLQDLNFLAAIPNLNFVWLQGLAHLRLPDVIVQKERDKGISITKLDGFVL